MTDHVDVYDLIARTSNCLRKKMKGPDDRPKYSRYVSEIQGNLIGVNNQDSAIEVMSNFLQKYEQ